jgi:protoheme IX farnesyltransferase
MGLLHATVVATVCTLGGVVYLALTTNLLTGVLAAATSVTYLVAYTPLKKVHPICTFVGAFPGAMPPALGWAAARGRLDWGALALFAIVFFWQFPHFHSIAWLYRDDYARAGIRMLPVVEDDGKSTARAILMYSMGLLAVSVAPSFMQMSGRVYLLGAAALGVAFLWFGQRLWALKQTPATASSRARARQLLQATVFYLPLLFALMMIDA